MTKQTKDIRIGHAVIMASETTMGKRIIYGWALPGGGFTSSKEVATNIAKRMSTLLKSYLL